MTQTAENTAEFSVFHGDLKKALRLAEFGIGGGQPPAIRGVVLDTEDGNLTLRSYNFDVAVAVPVPEATVTRRGRTILDHAELKACLTGAVAGEKPAVAAHFLLTVSGDVLKTPGMEIPVLAYQEEDYPSARSAAGTLATVDGAALVHQLARVLPAAGNDDTLPVLTCIQMELRDGNLRLSATDRYRLTCAEIPAQQAADALPTDPRALFPAKTLTRLLKLINGYEGPAEFGMDDDSVTLRLGGLEVTTYRREGALPKYDTLLPKAYSVGLTLDRENLTRAAKKSEGILKAKGLTGAGGQSTLSFASSGRVTVAPLLEPDQRDKVRGTQLLGEFATGRPETIEGAQGAFNGKFLTEALAAFDSGTITIHLSGPDNEGIIAKPVLITEETDPKAGNYRHLLMPVRITG